MLPLIPLGWLLQKTMTLASVFSDFVAFWLLLAVPSCLVWGAFAESREAIAAERARAGLKD